MSKIATGLDVGRVAGKMQTKATEALKAETFGTVNLPRVL